MDGHQSMTERLALRQHALEEEKLKAFEEAAGAISEFKSLFKSQYDIELTDENFTYVEAIGLLLIYPKLINLLIPDKKDKEGLYDMNALMTRFTKTVAAKGEFKSPQYDMFVTPLFRRGFVEYSNFQPGFLNKLWNYSNKEVNAYIALDENRVRVDTKAARTMEFDHWFGPKFNADIATIPDDIVKLVPPPEVKGSFQLGFFADAYALDIKWYTTVHTDKNKVTGIEIKTPVKAFQAEEFKQEYTTVKIDGKVYHPVRYLHAEFNLEKKFFQHFDGALHFYTPDEYFARRDADFHYNLKNNNQIKTKSEKLFKFDGKMPVEDWVSFCSLFFLQNPLIIEYFEGELPEVVRDFMQAFKQMNETSEG
jgi:hypothetical protein